MRRQRWRRRRADTEGAEEPDAPPRLLRKAAGRWVELTVIVYSRISSLCSFRRIPRTHGSYVFLEMGLVLRSAHPHTVDGDGYAFY